MLKPLKKFQGWFFERLSLKWILNIWSAVTVGLFCLDFFSGNKYDSQAGVIGVIYIAMLGIYVGEKEYIRWKTEFTSRFIGETFVGLWTAVLIVFAIAAPLSQGAFRIPAEFALVYTTVVGIFAITQHSKNLHSQRK